MKKRKKKILLLIPTMFFLFLLAGSLTPVFADYQPLGPSQAPITTNSNTPSSSSTNTATTTNPNSNQINLQCNMFDFNCKIEEFILNLVQGGINYSVQQLQVFIVDPQTILNAPTIRSFYGYAFEFFSTLLTVIFLYKMIEILALADPEGRGAMKGKLVKLVFTVGFAYGFKWIFQYLLTLNNWFIKGLLNGYNLKFSTIKYNQTKILQANINLTFMVILCLIIAILFFVLLIQMAIRFAELGFSFAIAPVVIATNVSDDLNLLPGFWKNLLSLIFTQSVQILIVLFMLKFFSKGSIWDPQKIMYGIGFMVLAVKSPHIVKELMYSSGAGRTISGIGTGAAATAIKTAWIRRVK
jgi:hypothetical protein